MRRLLAAGLVIGAAGLLGVRRARRQSAQPGSQRSMRDQQDLPPYPRTLQVVGFARCAYFARAKADAQALCDGWPERYTRLSVVEHPTRAEFLADPALPQQHRTSPAVFLNSQASSTPAVLLGGSDELRALLLRVRRGGDDWLVHDFTASDMLHWGFVKQMLFQMAYAVWPGIQVCREGEPAMDGTVHSLDGRKTLQLRDVFTRGPAGRPQIVNFGSCT